MKTVEEIYDEMLGVFRRETGAEASAVSDLSVKLYAVAAQVYGLYTQMEWLSKQCFPQTAQGEYLDRHATLRGLERRKATPATGVIRFSVEAAGGTDLVIPAGTVCTTAGLARFETTSAVTLTAGKTFVEAPAQAAEPGSGGNVPAGSILVMTAPPVGVSGCSNPQPFVGGTDGEEDEALRSRVLETYRRMPNGANSAYYQQEALSFDQVAACTVLPKKRGVGTVDVIVSTLAGIPEKDLLSQLQSYFDQRREIAVSVEVKAPTPKAVTVSVQVQAGEGKDPNQVKEAVEQTLRDFFTGERLSGAILVAQLNQLVFSTPGVANCTVLAPTQDLPAVEGELPQLDSLNVEVTA